MRCAVFAALVLGLSAGLVAAQPRAKAALLVGTVGASPIVMELQADATEPGGRYFYRRTRYDINFSGEAKSGVISLDAYATGDEFVLRSAGAGYAGEMTTKAGRRLPVSLHPLPASDSYVAERRAGLALAAAGADTVSGHRLNWFVVAQTGTRLFRIASGYPPAATTAINAALEKAQWQEVDDYFACPGEGGGPGMEESRISSVYLSDDFVSWAWSSSWSCAGAAHPDFGTEGHSFSARTGRELTLDGLLSFGKAPPTDTDAWRDYRSSVFAPGLLAKLKALHPKEMAPPGPDDGCDYSDPGVWDFPTWYLTAKGLYVGAVFARVARNCDNPEWAVIPWSALKKP